MLIAAAALSLFCSAFLYSKQRQLLYFPTPPSISIPTLVLIAGNDSIIPRGLQQFLGR